MIKTINAFTHELDEPEVAVKDILDQISPETNLLSNSVGIITCFSEYIEEGIVEELSDKLGIPTVGTTTLANVTGKEYGEDMLAVMVLTSDDVEFSIGLSDPVVSDDKAAIKKAYDMAMEGYSDKPSLLFTFAPLSQVVGGDFMTGALDEISGSVPLFGTITVDHNPDYSTSAVLYNGKSYNDRMSIILFHGEVNPKFVVASISGDVIMRDKDVVTESKGNQLTTVNNMSVVDYLLSLGMQKNENGEIEGINSIPFVVDYGDGSQPVIRILFALTEDGSAVCGGDIPTGTTLSVGSINYDEVLNTTKQAIESIRKSENRNGAVIFSCVGRFFALGFEPNAEMELITKEFPEEIPYLLTYSGGEICPTYDESGKLYNRFHNDTFAMCLL